MAAGTAAHMFRCLAVVTDMSRTAVASWLPVMDAAYQELLYLHWLEPHCSSLTSFLTPVTAVIATACSKKAMAAEATAEEAAVTAEGAAETKGGRRGSRAGCRSSGRGS